MPNDQPGREHMKAVVDMFTIGPKTERARQTAILWMRRHGFLTDQPGPLTPPPVDTIETVKARIAAARSLLAYHGSLPPVVRQEMAAIRDALDELLRKDGNGT